MFSGLWPEGCSTGEIIVCVECIVVEIVVKSPYETCRTTRRLAWFNGREDQAGRSRVYPDA